MLDAQPHANPTNVHELLRSWLRGVYPSLQWHRPRAHQCLQNPISPEILRVVAARVQANDRNDHLLLAPESEEVDNYELPLPREVSGLETYVPAYLNVSHLRRLAALVA